MIYFSFYGKAFRKEYAMSTIELIISSKNESHDIHDFFEKAVSYLAEKIYPDISIRDDFSGSVLKEGQYTEIIQKHFDSMSDISLDIGEIQQILRIKPAKSDPYSDKYIIETENEYIALLWSLAD